MSAPPATGGAAVLRRRLGGIAFLGVIVGLVALAIAFYVKAFTPVVEVALEVDTIGNQLSAPADVKIRGLIVGEVREITSTGDGATLELALDPDQAELIPRNVMAQLLPKTLFGEKYVSLVLPEDPSEERIEEGDVIGQDRSETAIETEQVLNDLLPLLQALRPQDVSVTLNALSGALRGRGNQIGENLELVDTYLRGFNPALPDLQENFRGIADFADTLDRTTPDLVRLLDNVSEISRNLVDQEQELNTFLTATATSTDELADFLRDNDERLVRLAADSLPPLQLFARYSPEFPCLAKGLAASDPIIGATFGGLQPGLHITLEFVEEQGGYEPETDKPAYKAVRGPECYGLPDPPTPAPDINFQDGYNDRNGPNDSQRADEEEAGPVADPAVALASPAGQRAAMGSVLGPVMGMASDDVPDLAYLLFGPVARGTEVGLR